MNSEIYRERFYELEKQIEIRYKLSKLKMEFYAASGVSWIHTCEHHKKFPDDLQGRRTCDCGYKGPTPFLPYLDILIP